MGERKETGMHEQTMNQGGHLKPEMEKKNRIFFPVETWGSSESGARGAPVSTLLYFLTRIDVTCISMTPTLLVGPTHEVCEEEEEEAEEEWEPQVKHKSTCNL